MKIEQPEDIHGAVLGAGANIWVYFDPETFDDAPTVLNTAVHESVHVWQHIKEYIQEQEPGKEQEAYTIAYITDILLADIAKYMEKTSKSQKESKNDISGNSLHGDAGIVKETEAVPGVRVAVYPKIWRS